MKVKYLTYNDIYFLLENVEFPKFDRVIGVGRAGAIVGGMIATMLDKKFSYCHVGSNEINVLPEPKSNEMCLIVDDVCATGRTLKSVIATFKERGWKYKVFVIVDDVSRTKENVKIDIAILRDEGNVWYLFPWDLQDYIKGERLSYSRRRLE